VGAGGAEIQGSAGGRGRVTVMSRALHLIQPRRAAQSAGLVDKIAIVGLGCIGGSLALAAREIWPTALVIGVDANDVVEKAMLRHAVDVASHDLGIVGDAGLIVLTHDEARNADVLAHLPRHVEGAAIVTDTAGTKTGIVEAAKALPRRLAFIGGHPLVEPHEGGIDAARPDFFAASQWVLVPPEPPNDEAFDRLWRVVSDLGALPASMTAAKHDRLVAWLSHLPALVVASLLETLGRSVAAGDLRFAGSPLTELAGLVPSSPAEWAARCQATSGELGAALDECIESLQQLRGRLSDGQVLEDCARRALAFRQKAAP